MNPNKQKRFIKKTLQAAGRREFKCPLGIVSIFWSDILLDGHEVTDSRVLSRIIEEIKNPKNWWHDLGCPEYKIYKYLTKGKEFGELGIPEIGGWKKIAAIKSAKTVYVQSEFGITEFFYNLTPELQKEILEAVESAARGIVMRDLNGRKEVY
jgi:hypothetical protein